LNAAEGEFQGVGQSLDVGLCQKCKVLAANVDDLNLDKAILEVSLEDAQRNGLRLQNLVRKCLDVLRDMGMQTMDTKLKHVMEADAPDILLEYPDAVDLRMSTDPRGVPRGFQRELDQISQAIPPQIGHLQAAESQYNANEFDFDDFDAWFNPAEWQTEAT
jgi:hypothetical protein